jgi:hypothetical protein
MPGTGGRVRHDAAVPIAATDAAIPPAPPSPPPVAVTLTAIADTFGQNKGTMETDRATVVDNTDVNFGGDLLLLAKYRPDDPYYWRESFIKFDCSRLPSVATAQLIFTARTSDPDGGTAFRIHQMDDVSWQESVLTWNNRPTMGSPIGRGVVKVGPKQKIVFDVTEYVRAAQKAHLGTIAFGVTQDEQVAYDNHGRVEIDSREAGATGPQLVVKPLP